MTRLKPAGFTLIELLVVIVIIAILASVATLSINVLGRDREVGTEAKRIAGLIGMVREQAEMQSHDYGLMFGDTGYGFLMYAPRLDQWRPTEDDPLLRPRTLPAGLRLRLTLEGREIVL